MFCYKCKRRTNVDTRIELASRDNKKTGFLRICQQCENMQVNVVLEDKRPNSNRIAQLNNNLNSY